jgi:predicted ATP-binding protein involved in virulence
MKIRKLHIKNYKIFDDLALDFTDDKGNTLDLIVLGGENGCGKTTLLEVITKLAITPQNFVGADLLLSKDEQKMLYQLDKTIKEILTIPLLDLKSSIFTSIIRQKNKLIETAINIPITYFPVSRPSKTFSNVTYLLLEKDKEEMHRIAIKTIRDEVFKNQETPPKQIIQKGIKEINEILRGIDLNTKLVDLESEELVFESANGQRIHFNDLSNGEKNLYFRAIYLHKLNIENSILLIDEPETSLHPKWQKAVVQLYQNIGKNNQVILATHSPHIMASVAPESLFILTIDEKNKKIVPFNVGKQGKHSKGLEPNRILREIMQVDMLRDFETQIDIEKLSNLLNINDFERKETEELADKLKAQLGEQDPFIIRLDHQLLILKRQKAKQADALH